MQTKNHLPSIFILIGIGLGVLLLIGTSALLALISVIDLFDPAGDPATSMISSMSFGFIAVLLGVCFWFVLKKTRGLESAEAPFNLPFTNWLWLIVPVVSFFGLLFGGVITLAEQPWLNWLALPIFTILVIVPPIGLFFGAASHGIDAGARWRFFSVLGLSMSVSPFVILVFELIILVLAVVVLAIYAAIFQPDLATKIDILAQAINSAPTEEAMTNLLAPYLTNPYLIATVLGYIALLVPLIEELFKPLAVWLFAKQIDSPAQGFVLGALSGVGFTLLESLNAGADGTTSWAFVAGARTGTSVLHVMTSALVGWGIVSAFKERKIGRFFAAYFSAALIHGLWNASAAGAGFSFIGEAIGKSEWLYTFAPALLCGMLTLGIGIVALLLASNRALRKQNIPTQLEEEVKVESSI
ncbi:MAG: PrsW family intramembrane metalloprotease [Anaerolineales bacterium]|nr:PrsW family intramembrane metalloprotease [Anaerolineales bacterium]MCB9145584.1 PrsW family intramembrane metalloprotease [Anaerolineales bacterium]